MPLACSISPERFLCKDDDSRERSRLYYGLSVGVHIVAAAAVGLMLPLWAALPFVALFLRAVWMPGQKVTIKQVGIAEIVFSIVTAIPLIAVITP